MFELILLPPAIRFLESVGGGERQEIWRLLDMIAEDPFWDQRTKFPFPVPPVIVSIYDSGRYKIVYHVLNSAYINIWAIGYSGDRPEIH